MDASEPSLSAGKVYNSDHLLSPPPVGSQSVARESTGESSQSSCNTSVELLGGENKGVRIAVTLHWENAEFDVLESEIGHTKTQRID